MISEFDEVVLTVDLPEYGLKAGDLGTVADIRPNGSEYTLEFFTLDGKTIAVIPVLAEYVRPVGSQEIAAARPLE